MKNLNIRAFGGLLFLIIILAASLFFPTWTLYYWQAWIFLGVFSVSVLSVTIYLMKKSEALGAAGKCRSKRREGEEPKNNTIYSYTEYQKNVRYRLLPFIW